MVFWLDNRFYLLVQIGLINSYGGIEVVGPVGPLLRSDESALNELIEDFSEELTITFVRSPQEKRQHGQHHEQRCCADTHVGLGKKKQRDAQRELRCQMKSVVAW